MKYFIMISLLFVFIACNHKRQNSSIKNTSNENDSILITYACGLILTDVSIRCEKLAEIQNRHPKNEYSYVMVNGKLEPFPVELIDTCIVDSTIINRVVRLLDNVKKTDDYDGDARMYVTIKRSDGRNDNLCFDYFPYRAKYNGQSCALDKELLFLLRYYSGYYSWFDERNLDWFEELKDTVLYQKAVEQIKMNKWNSSNEIKK